jgi:hypothetical protein
VENPENYEDDERKGLIYYRSQIAAESTIAFNI